MGIVLVVVPLREILKQQFLDVEKLPGGNGFILDKQSNSSTSRQRIAAGVYTHG